MRCARRMPPISRARLKVIGEVAAGRPFERKVGTGEAVRIFTGGVIPDGADAVIIQEDTAVDGDHITITEAAVPGRHIRPAGVDFREGDVLLTRGRRLTDRDLSLAAGMNYPELAVRRRPKVAVLGTGDELVMPGVNPGPRPDRLFQRLRACGRWRAPRAPRSSISASPPTRSPPPRTASAGRARLEADILITMGGASVGDHDLVKRSLEAEGTAMAFWRIAMRPGKPMMHGRLGAMRVIGLPGNPVSSYVCGFLFLVPLIRALSGRDTIHHVRESAVLGRDLAANDQREDYLRARLEARADGTPIAVPVNHQDFVAVGESRCGTGTCDTSAVRAGSREGFALASCSGCRNDALTGVAVPAEAAMRSPEIKWLRNTYRTYSVRS